MLTTYRAATKNGQLGSMFPFLEGTTATLDDVISKSNCVALDDDDAAVIARCAFRNDADMTPVDAVPVDTTLSPWSDVESILLPSLSAMLRNGENIGVVSDFGVTLCKCRCILQLVVAMRSKLQVEQWGDNSMYVCVVSASYLCVTLVVISS